MGITEGQNLEEGSKIKNLYCLLYGFIPYGNYIIYGKWHSFVLIISEISGKSVWCAENESDVCQSEYITEDVHLFSCDEVALLQQFNKAKFDNFLQINTSAWITNRGLKKKIARKKKVSGTQSVPIKSRLTSLTWN